MTFQFKFDGGTPGYFSKRTVNSSREFHRIADMPRRTWSDEEAAQLAASLTSRLKMPGGTWSLRPKQAIALYEFGMTGGLVGLLRVGAGKTLLSMLLPRMPELVGRKVKFPVLILPASLIEKTQKERHILSKNWRLGSSPRLISYEALGRVSGADILDQYEPNLIICDEVHRVKNHKAGVTRRLKRYMDAHPDTMFAALSGTLVKRSLKDAAHIIRWAMKDRSPIPFGDEFESWADALDEGTNMLNRVHPGPLVSLATEEDQDPDVLVTARRGFRRRMMETAGVVATGGETVDSSLNISVLEYPEDPVTNAHFKTLRGDWLTPDGWSLAEPVQVWACARQLALGFHYLQVNARGERPPPEWLAARKAWAAFVRDILSNSRHLDTELQVRNAVDSGALCSSELTAWREISPTFTPIQKAQWHDTSALEACQTWLAEDAGICWTEHTFFAEELSRRSGVPYYGAQGLTSTGESIVGLAESNRAGKVPIIASVAANSTGRNLQAWNRNLITSFQGGASDNEQLLGRTHRDGQLADEVSVEILLGCFEHWDSFWKSRAQATALRDMALGDDPKLLLATVNFPEEMIRPGARWTKNVLASKNIVDLLKAVGT